MSAESFLPPSVPIPDPDPPAPASPTLIDTVGLRRRVGEIRAGRSLEPLEDVLIDLLNEFDRVGYGRRKPPKEKP